MSSSKNGNERNLRNAKEDSERLLRNAQEDASRLLRNAKEDSERLLRNAQEDASRLLRNAKEDSERLLRNAQKETDFDFKESPQEDTENHTQKNSKMHTIGEMSSRLAHDLQNPLAVIKNTLEILKLKHPNIDEKTKENYERIERAASRMSQQIKDVLDYVRMSNLLMEKTSLMSLLKTVITDMEIPENIKIILPSEDVMVYGDVKQLEVVFSNMILNSIQAISEEGKIMIQASENDENVVIDIVDNGPGISKENLPHIFEPLFTTKQNGTGLGLASCRSIIENHGGTIDCSSIVGKGTVFTIKLPRN